MSQFAFLQNEWPAVFDAASRAAAAVALELADRSLFVRRTCRFSDKWKAIDSSRGELKVLTARHEKCVLFVAKPVPRCQKNMLVFLT